MSTIYKTPPYEVIPMTHTLMMMESWLGIRSP